MSTDACYGSLRLPMQRSEVWMTLGSLLGSFRKLGLLSNHEKTPFRVWKPPVDRFVATNALACSH